MSKIDAYHKGRLEKFLQKCRSKCGSSKIFQINFDIAGAHFNKGIIKDPMRSSFDREFFASVILSGVLNLENSSEGPPLEITIEGKLLDYEWMNINDKNCPTIIEDAIHARIIVRETRTKNLIVQLMLGNVLEN